MMRHTRHYNTFDTLEALALMSQDIGHVAMCIQRDIYSPVDNECKALATQLLETITSLNCFIAAKRGKFDDRTSEV